MLVLFLIAMTSRIHVTFQSIASTAQGKIRGVPKDGYVSYNGIPYASLSSGPGSNFKRASLAPTWEDIRESHQSHCSPRSPVEKCLQLDINTPFGSDLPVLVWVAGGRGHYNPTKLVREGIIVVIIRHRLGPQGFLCSSEDNIPGNAGVKDVVLALRWVRDNIVAFNGNPNKVVVAGQSFGAAIVETLMLTTMAQGLFHGVILQSGTVLAPWAFNYDAEHRVKLLKAKFNDTTFNRVSAVELTTEADKLTLTYLPFGICIDFSTKNEERLLSASPFDMLSKGMFTKVPMMMGYTNNEGYIFASTLNEARILRRMPKDMSFLLPIELQSDKRNMPKLVKEIYEMYFTHNMTMSTVLAYHRDAYFLSHIHRGVRFHANTDHPVFYYQFSYRGHTGVVEEPGIVKSGAAHSDELGYLFPDKGRDMHDDDRVVQENLIRLWTNFVKHLNPTPEKIQDSLWNPVDPYNPQLLNINEELEMIDFPFKKEAEMWGDIYEKYYFNTGKSGLRAEYSMTDWWHVSVVVAIHLLAGGGGRGPTAPHRDVVTTQGVVRGYRAPRPPHYAYLGIPYARPPTDHHRYKAPEPPVPWSGIFEAIHRIRCPQPDGSGEENCLVINVFTPYHNASLPVIVYFHDGGFQQGWGFYSAPSRLLEQSFVIVSFNYRLGALGFLCLGLEEISGNTGLKDQVAALYWVNRNVDKFGGNPADVTVYGTGSGAVSIELLLYSGITRDLFQKAILNSGSALAPSTISYEPISSAFYFARNLGYKEEFELTSLKEFYYKISYKKVTYASKIFVPCIETESISNSLLYKDPREYLADGKYQHVPMMIIYTNAEEISVITDNNPRFYVIPESFTNLLPKNLMFDSDDTKHTVAGLIKDFYFDDLELTQNIMQSYVNYINDIFMEYPVVKSATYNANKQNLVYLMKFLYNGKLSANKQETIPGAGYGDISQYIFTNEQLEDYDEIVAQRLITMWTNFIKLGDPTPLSTLLIPEIWQPLIPHLVDNKVILRNIACLMFGRTMKNGLLVGQQFAFWDHIYEKFHRN